MLLAVENLTVDLATPRGVGHAVRGLSFTLDRGETLGIVGESGCGKTMTALAIMGLLPENAVVGGRVLFEGTDLLSLAERARGALRGNRVAMVFQEPMTALNPLHPIGAQVAEPLMLHRRWCRAEAMAEALRLLDRVGIAEPDLRARNYPHQLSGGQRQRAMIAMALACRPDLLIADEPTSALDVVVQRQILDLIRDLVRGTDMALLLISHDLGVIAENAGRILVMYGGTGVETGPVAGVFQRLAHPYSQGLFGAAPARALSLAARPARLPTIPGSVPDLVDWPPGCPFAERCDLVVPTCRAAVPAPVEVAAGHYAACLRTSESLARWSGR